MIRGFAEEILDRLPKDAIAGPPPRTWGSADAATAAYWARAHRRLPRHRHLVADDRPGAAEARESRSWCWRAACICCFHAWGARRSCEDGAVAGVVFESKEGRLAIRARVTVDCTGDGDIFAPRRRRLRHRRRGARHAPLHEHVWICAAASTWTRWIAFATGDAGRGFPPSWTRGREACGGCSSGRSCPGATTSRCSWGRGCPATPRSMSRT